MTEPTKKEQLRNNAFYASMKKVALYSDQYYLDAIVGLIPGGIGDLFTALFSATHIYFSLFKLHSLPLTLAVVNNTLRDIFFGLIPFYAGNIIDFFHKSNVKNMQLIDGFINDDQAIIRTINRKALSAALILLANLLLIAGLLYGLAWLTQAIGTWLFS